MTENESINGWTFEETIKIAENLMEAESNMLKWDTLRHLRDFLENYKEELEQYRAIGTVEELKALKEKSVAKKPIQNDLCNCPSCGSFNEVIRKRRNAVSFDTVHCWHCGQAIEIERD